MGDVAVGAPGVCFDINGEWWHEPGSCYHCRTVPDRRPARADAEAAVRRFLDGQGLGGVVFELVEDGGVDSAAGKCGWAFWVHHHDTTSFVHEDLSIEWYGTTYEDEDDV